VDGRNVDVQPVAGHNAHQRRYEINLEQFGSSDGHVWPESSFRALGE
jgi:hypothetical protein